jgi:uncharacterized protein (DUF433 family)
MSSPSTADLPHVSIEHIAIDERGNAHIAGSRIKVQHIVELKQAHSYTAEQLQSEAYPHLRLGQIHAALAYYYDHQEQIDKQIKEDREAYDREWQKQQNDPAYRELIANIRSRAATRQ